MPAMPLSLTFHQDGVVKVYIIKGIAFDYRWALFYGFAEWRV